MGEIIGPEEVPRQNKPPLSGTGCPNHLPARSGCVTAHSSTHRVVEEWATIREFSNGASNRNHNLLLRSVDQHHQTTPSIFLKIVTFRVARNVAMDQPFPWAAKRGPRALRSVYGLFCAWSDGWRVNLCSSPVDAFNRLRSTATSAAIPVCSAGSKSGAKREE